MLVRHGRTSCGSQGSRRQVPFHAVVAVSRPRKSITLQETFGSSQWGMVAL